MTAASPPSPIAPLDLLPALQRQLVEDAAVNLPERTRQVLASPAHRALGRVVRDAVLLLGTGLELPDGDPERWRQAARAALHRLSALQHPSGTFCGGDNVDSPPDTAFTVNDLAWARVALDRAAAEDELSDMLDGLLRAVTPALVHGGVHTPNHRWEIASALARLWEAGGPGQARARALDWLAEGVDLQSDGMFSERSANYAAHVSIPSLLVMSRVLEMPELIEAADRGTLVQAQLTDEDGMVETLASRRQDQFSPFDGGALHPWFRAHAARTGDAATARAALRTAHRADAAAVLTLLAHATEEPSALHPTPSPAPAASPDGPELVELEQSGLVRADHGVSRTVLFGGTDTAAIGRLASGASSQPVIARFGGGEVSLREVRLSRDFFSLGPLRPSPPRRLDTQEPDGAGSLSYAFEERVEAAYFQPLSVADRDPSGRYELGFNGRFAAAMDFPRRPADTVRLTTSVQADLGPARLDLHFRFEGPQTPLCLLLALDGGTLDADLPRDAQGRSVLAPSAPAADASQEHILSMAGCHLDGDEESLVLSASGALGGHAFYDPGEAYSFLGASDEPGGTVLLIPASTSAPLTLSLRLGPARDD